MAEGILFDLAGRLVEELGSLVIKEIGLAAEVRGEIGKLEETMRSIKAVLLDAEERQGQKNHQVTEWLLRLKEAVYDADDLLDDFATELQLREDVASNRMAKEVCICFSKSNKLAYGLKMGHKIKAIREKLDAIQNTRGFHLDENPVQNVGREQTHSYVHADDVIGRDHDKNAIIQRLLDSDNVDNVSVIPIVGIGGLGKTTLTKLIYNDEKIKTNFQLRMWVCVADVFDVRIIVQNIIKSAIAEDVERLQKLKMDQLNMDQLQKCLNEEITSKKYLLVLDDIWNENRESWLKLEMLLMNGMKGSQILITTRSKRVAKISSTLPFHELRGLSEDQSWSLFTKMAFEHGREPEGSNLVQIGKCIVKKCIGVPLAIRTIGRFLYHNYREDYWVHFKEHELSQLLDQEESDILPTLKLSFDHLPSHLKQCFAYCALFPKDYIIKKEYLVDLWMAQGFLKSSNMNYQSLEVIGNDYFMSLLSRSFFQDVDYDNGGNVITCKMHDLLHDLATQVSRSECALLKLDSINYQAKGRHISFDSKLDFSWKLPKALFEENHIRTFLLPIHSSYPIIYQYASNFNKIISSFTCLRTLDLIGLDIQRLPNSISKLKHLRHLDMSYNPTIIKLPNSMSRLKNLQILKLKDCLSLKELPRDIRKMVNLRCLMVDGCRDLNGMPRGLESLTNLRRLSTFVLGSKSGKYAELFELDGLLNNLLSGELAIRGLRKASSKHSLLANLKAQKNLEHLTLDWGFSKSDGASIIAVEALECLQPHHSLKALAIENFMGLSISTWLSSLTNLTSIRIWECKRCRHIPRLDQLPSLKSLTLDQLHDLEYISELDSSSTSFFPSLKEIWIGQCGNLKGWWRDVDNDDGAMKLPSFPCLSKLEIIHCPNLTSMPLYPSLEELRLRPLQQKMMLMNVATPSTSSTVSAPFSKLKSLKIECCDNLDLLINVDDKQWQGFTSLNSITFWEIRELVSLPQGLQHVPNLQNLNVWYCQKLVDLPEGMQLQFLRIDSCPQLSERCGNNMGVDWQKISHIPNIVIDVKWIQKEGCYQLKTEGEGEGAGSSSA